MIDLIEATAPRSDELVATTLGKRYLQARARAGAAALRLFAVMTVSTLVYAWSRSSEPYAEILPYIVAGTIVLCGLAALGNRRLRLRSLNLVRTIVRDGHAHRTTVTNHRKRPGNLEILDLAWDGGRARVDLYNTPLTGREHVTIITHDGRTVAAIAGVGAFLAVNTTP